MADNKPQADRADLEIERVVLGSALLGADNLQYIIENCRTDDLSTPQHILIRRTLAEIFQSGRSVDRNTLLSTLQVSGDIQKVGGEAYVRSLESAVPFGDWDLPSYVGILRDLNISRKLIALGSKISGEARQGNRSQDILSQAETYLRSMGEYLDDSGTLLDTTQIIERAGGIDKLVNPYGNDRGVQTPFPELNTVIGGLHERELTTIGANTSRGKSVMAGQIAYWAAMGDEPTAYFSYEMGSDALLRRMICAAKSIPVSDVRSGELTSEQRSAFNTGLAELSEKPLYISDIAGRNLLQIEAEVRRLEARTKKKTRLLIFDHIQLMRGHRSHYSNRTQELTEISGDLKEYLLKNRYAGVCLSQLNRDNTKRKDGRPEVGDLRESGSLEQDSDNIHFIHRPEFYDRNDSTLINQVVYIIGKQREGEVRDVNLRWNGGYVRFESPDR